jgi:hypothetical protein
LRKDTNMEELKRKIIQYEVLTHESASEVMLVRITRQSDRKEHFGVNGTDEFVASNGLHLQSHCSPAVTEDIKEFGVFVRGEDHEDDDDVLVFRNREDFLLFKIAVREYNSYDFGTVDNTISVETINKAKANISYNVDDVIKNVQWYIASLRDAKTVEDILYLKRKIMYAFTDFPLNSDCCPYCLHFNYPTDNPACTDCQYGKRNGICRKDDSKFQAILKARNVLRAAINEY